MARGTCADVTWHTRSRDRAARAQVVPCGMDAWQGPCESRWTPGWAHVARGAGKWRAHGLVGPGNRIGAVTQSR